MAMFKLKPACKNYLWGGSRLIDEYKFKTDEKILAEAWMLSSHKDGMSEILTGEFAGKTFAEYLNAEGRKVLGTNCENFKDFPVLIKFIDAKDNLSIQVHPNDSYALQNENQLGKDEFWYILDAEPDAFIYYGFNREISKEEFAWRIHENNLSEVLNKVKVHKGDSFFISAGTLHSIGKGILLAEIQKNSNVSYRIYDYDRIGADGKKRDLHIEQALDVTNLSPTVIEKNSSHLAACEYFTVDKIHLDGEIMQRISGVIDEKTFLSILILDGEGILSGEDNINFQKGDSIFISANSGNWEISGECDAILTTVQKN